MPDEKCRLAKLEERADAQEEQVASMRNDLSYIRTTLDNQRGFVRGIAFTITAIVSGIGLFINYWNK
mgnify:FL=1